MKRVTIVVLFLLSIQSSCTKEELIPRPYPRVNTLTIKTIDTNGALFTGEIFYSDVPILDHGFLWSPYSNPQLGAADKVSLGKKTGTGSFEGLAGWGMENGKTYYMRAFAVTSDKEVYGDVEKFVAKGTPPPVLNGIYPEQATWADTVALIGSNFSMAAVTNPVTINGMPVDIIGGDNDTIKVKVSYTLAKEFNNVTVFRQGYSSTSPKQLQLKAPEIQSISPSNGSAGTQVTISGLYLGSSVSKVYFDGVNAPLTNLLLNAVVVKVPNGLPAGNVTVKIVTGDGNLYDTTTFTAL